MPESVTDRPTKAHEYLFLLSKGPRYFYDADAVREERARPGAATAGARSGRNGQRAARARCPGHSIACAAFGGRTGRNKRSVWTVATAPFAGAHFATFPPKLIEPCILAGSPPKCCGVCGAPWRRVVERTAMVDGRRRSVSAWQADGRRCRDGWTGGTMVEPPTSRTVGWESTCTHDDDTGSSVILDPFAGSGTTGMVALRHNRSFIGCELNPAYAQMARERIVDDCPLHNSGLEIAA
jgi:hypothetical protein